MNNLIEQLEEARKIGDEGLASLIGAQILHLTIAGNIRNGKPPRKSALQRFEERREITERIHAIPPKPELPSVREQIKEPPVLKGDRRKALLDQFGKNAKRT